MQILKVSNPVQACYNSRYAPHNFRKHHHHRHATRVSICEGDLAALLQAYKPQIEPLYDELADHLTDTDMAEVKSIVDEIQQPIKRFERRFRDVE